MAPPNVKIKHITRSPSSSGDTRFPKLDECAHFHYDNVELGPIKVLLCDKQTDPCKSVLCSSLANKENETDHLCFLVTVISNSKKWVVRRSYKNFIFLDTQLHRCVYDRKYSLLQELPNLPPDDAREENFEVKIRELLSQYLERFSQLAGSLINCGPVLNWFELDNRGNRLIVTDEVAINTPAVAAAYVVVPYSAQATDEISFDVGDMISVIDMPPPEESSWWRGKKGFEVGFFPSECVEVIGDKVPHSFKLSNSSTKPVFRRHGKLIAFFRSFLLSRPSRRKLKQSGILKERVFGCDLGEHLLNTGREIPMVLKCCSEFIEQYGIVDGIYRLSGVSSNIQRLRLAFDEDRPLNLGDPATVHDIHSVASLLKMYFRELPNPLLTYQLYDKFVSAVQSNEDMRLLKVRDVVQQLPPPHFRTLQYLLSHLARVASHGEATGMTPKNIAIVWAPNLLRSRDVENGGVGALHVVGVQAVLTEYLIRFSDLIFDEKVPFLSASDQEGLLRARPKSLAISTPTKLLSLEEARARALSTHLPASQQKYIEVGGGPDKLPSKYHTVIDLPTGKQSLPKLKKSPSGWKSFFSRGWYSGSTRDKSRLSFSSARKASTGSLPHHSAFLQEKTSEETDAPYGHRKKLRTVKSAESLAHCLKESPQRKEREETYDNINLKSSPQASVDSSHSFEISPLPKSPGLQKHTRSSSHESYFESSSMDVISEPSFEDEEHSLFYYVSEQMRMLQQQSSEWTSDDNKTIEDSVFHSEDSISMKSSDGADKNTARKQKLSFSDDNAQVKYQRINEESDDSFGVSALECPSNEFFGFPPIHMDEECDVWGQKDDFISFHNKEDLTLDPVLLYEAVINKRSPVFTESDVNNHTVVERYGNAETVLVEVHATQESSEEEERYSPVAASAINDMLSVIKDISVSTPQEEAQDSKIDFSGHGRDSLPCIESGEVFVDEQSVERFLITEDVNEEVQAEMSKSVVSSEATEVFNREMSPMYTTESVMLKDETGELEYSDIVTSEVVEKPSDLGLDTTRHEIIKSDSFDDPKSFSINTPPSPIYPPKSLKLPDFQSLRTRIDKLPPHKKKQIVIPSPSSPVEEVRKKFELKASSSDKNKEVESPTADVKYRNVKDLTPKLVRAFETTEPSEPKSEVKILEGKTPVAKRHSEPATRNVNSESTPGETVRRMSNKYEERSPKTTSGSEKQLNRISNKAALDNKPKVSPQPSLFTQLKIRKLQSLQAESVSKEPTDPWSDPILDDLQEEYHPVITYLPSPEKEDEKPFRSSANKKESESSDCLDNSSSSMVIQTVPSPVVTQSAKQENVFKKVEVETQPVVQTMDEKLEVESSPVSSQLCGLKSAESTPESEAVKRERINRIKEERRAQLREKLKQESFRMEAEEKEKVQTKFRLRKDSSKHCLTEAEDIKKSDKAVETDSANITETGTNCDLNVLMEALNKSELKNDSDSKTKDFVLLQNQSNSGRKSGRSYEDSRKWLSMPPTDIRDKVAMFERSKEANELCRLGPNGKFPQKQSPSALASSFVR